MLNACEEKFRKKVYVRKNKKVTRLMLNNVSENKKHIIIS